MGVTLIRWSGFEAYIPYVRSKSGGLHATTKVVNMRTLPTSLTIVKDNSVCMVGIHHHPSRFLEGFILGNMWDRQGLGADECGCGKGCEGGAYCWGNTEQWS